MNKIKIIATLGPSTFKKKILNELKKNIDIFRLNMSHLTIKQLNQKLILLKKNNINNICIDTEGAQIRTIFKKKKLYKKNTFFKITSNKFKGKNLIQFYPTFSFSNIKINTKVSIGFSGLKAIVIKKNKNYLLCKVVSEGYLEPNKGVHFDTNIDLKPLTDKDYAAIKLAKKFKIKIFALSFANSSKDVKLLKSILHKNDTLISKIETRKGFENRKKITKLSNAILIDRGDLSRFITISKIPLAQRIIMNDAKKINKKVYIATNLLETMIHSNEPTRAESNDIFSSLESGCKGLVLAAETAIGKNPLKCVEFLKECLQIFNNKKKYLLNNNKFF